MPVPVQSYAQIADLGTCGLPRLFFTGDLAPTVDDQQTVLNEVAAMIDGLIDACPDITLPLSTPYDPTLIWANKVIAAWRFLSNRGYNPENPTDNSVRMQHDDAMKWVDKIATSRAKLKRQVTAPNPIGVQPDVVYNESRGLRNWGGYVGSGGWR